MNSFRSFRYALPNLIGDYQTVQKGWPSGEGYRPGAGEAGRGPPTLGHVSQAKLPQWPVADAAEFHAGPASSVGPGGEVDAGLADETLGKAAAVSSRTFMRPTMPPEASSSGPTEMSG